MTEQAEKVEGTSAVVFVGGLSKEIRAVEASSNYYSEIRKILFDSGCCVMAAQGNRGRPSVIELLRRPDESDVPQDLTLGRDEARLRFTDLEKRVETLEGWREQFSTLNVMEALRDYERRISQLEMLIGESNAKAT